jgi:hypothetical protein
MMKPQSNSFQNKVLDGVHSFQKYSALASEGKSESKDGRNLSRKFSSKRPSFMEKMIEEDMEEEKMMGKLNIRGSQMLYQGKVGHYFTLDDVKDFSVPVEKLAELIVQQILQSRDDYHVELTSQNRLTDLSDYKIDALLLSGYGFLPHAKIVVATCKFESMDFMISKKLIGGDDYLILLQSVYSTGWQHQDQYG